ncbi:MAG: hypothetical protein ACOC4M_15200 [Promethearchaeia archaeon]
MPICTEVSSYSEVCIPNEHIVDQLKEKDAKIVVEGLLKKFPQLINTLLDEKPPDYPKIFPESIKHELIRKFQEENKSIIEFIENY